MKRRPKKQVKLTAAKPRKYSLGKRVLVGAGILALTALAGVTLRHSFSPKVATETSDLRPPTTSVARSYRQEINNARKDSVHGSETPVGWVMTNPRFTRSDRINLLFPGSIRCVVCHDFKQLPAKLGQKILDRDHAVKSLFDPADTHSDLANAIIMFPEFASMGHELAGTTSAGINFNLPNFANPTLQEDILGHELAHFHTSRAGDYLAEAWVVPANLLAVGPSKLAHVDEHNIATKYVAILQRAARLLGKMPETLEPNNHRESANSLKRCSQYVTHAELRESLGDLFKRSFSEYRKNNVFWDAASYEFQNQYLPLDVHIAQELFRRRDPALLYVLEHRDRLQQNAEALRVFGQKMRRASAMTLQDLKQKPTHPNLVRELDLMGRDVRNHMATQPGHLDSVSSDATYYGTLFHLFCNSDGSLNYTAIPKNSLEFHAREKANLIEREVIRAREERDKNSGELKDSELGPLFRKVVDEKIKRELIDLQNIQKQMKAGQYAFP